MNIIDNKNTEDNRDREVLIWFSDRWLYVVLAVGVLGRVEHSIWP